MATNGPQSSDPPVFNEDNPEIGGTADKPMRPSDDSSSPLNDDALEEPGVEQEEIAVGDRPTPTKNNDSDVDSAD